MQLMHAEIYQNASMQDAAHPRVALFSLRTSQTPCHQCILVPVYAVTHHVRRCERDQFEWVQEALDDRDA